MPHALKLLIAAITGVLGILAGLLGLLLAVAAADRDAMAFMIGKAAAGVLGRSVEIGGAGFVDWGWPMVIELTDVRIANAPWADEPSIARADRIEVALAVSGLLPPSLRLPRLTMTASAVSLAVRADGTANWQGLLPGSGGSRAATSAAPPDLFGLQQLRIVDGSLSLRDAAPGGAYPMHLQGVQVNAPAVDQPIAVEGRGQLATGAAKPASQDIRFTGTFGSLRQLRHGELPVEASASVGQARAEVSGLVDSPFGARSLDLRAVVDGETLRPLLALAGVTAPATPPFRAEARVTGQGARWTAQGIQARLGDSRFEGKLMVDASGPKPMITGEFAAPTLALDQLLALASQGSGNGAPRGLPFDWLRKAEADLALRAERIEAQDLPLRRASASLTLRDGVLRIDPLHLAIADGGVGGKVTVDSTQSPPTIGGSVDLDAIGMQAIMSALSVSKRVTGRVTGTVDVRSAGTTLQDLAETLDGTARFFVREGQFTTQLIDSMAVNVGEALGFLFSEGEMRTIDCIVGRFDIANGVIDPETLVFVTPDMVLRGKGHVDLAGKTIELTLVPRPRERHLLDVTMPVDVRGPLPDPRVDIGLSFWTRLAKDGVCRRALPGQDGEQTER